MRTECVFCQIAAGRAPASIVYQNTDIIAFRDIHPVAPTHILVVPRKHIRNVTDASPSDLPVLAELLRVAAVVAEREGLQHGYRLVANNGPQSGQAVYHLHFHLLGGRRMGWPPG